MTDLNFALAQSALERQPFSEPLGAELISFDAHGVELRLPIQDKHKQQHGFVHGGVLAYLADNALTFAGGSALGSAVVTSGFTINYLRPGQGTALLAKARVVHAGKTQAVCQCEVFVLGAAGEAPKLCAVAQGTIAAIDVPKSA
jgi:uncharacterized protein (TIGR00369 family)